MIPITIDLQPGKRRRLRLPFVVLLALLVTSMIAMQAWTGRSSGLDAGTTDPKQVAAAKTWLATLPVAGQAMRDAYATSCGVSTSYCLTSSTLPPERFVSEVLALARANGATRTTDTCVPAHEITLLGRCRGNFSYHGANLLVAADTVSALGVTNQTWLFVIVGDAGYQPIPSKPLGSWQSVNPLPDTWRGAPQCVSVVAAGCNGYRGSLTSSGSPEETLSAAAESLALRGYLVDSRQRCHRANSGSPASCKFVATRFRTVGGLDRVFISGFITSVTPSSSSIRVILDVGVGGPPGPPAL